MLNEGQKKPWIDIAPSRGWRSIDLRELWEYRELLYILAWRDVKVRYRQTILGIGWVIAQPLVTVVVFTILFNRVAKIRPDVNVPYSVFVMAALVPWTLFSSGVTAAGNSLIGSVHLISKVYFPRMIVPAASVVAGLVDMAVVIAAVLAMMLATHSPLSWTIVLIPLPIAICLALCLGVGLWLSALNVEYRDIRVVTPVLVQFWLYATPILYPISALPDYAHVVARFNPMTPVVYFFRGALTGGILAWSDLAYSAVIAAIVLTGGAFYFRRMERRFADVL